MNATANHRAFFRPLRISPLPVSSMLAIMLLVSGCASVDADYPSLAIRDVERAHGEMAAPPAPPPLPLPDTSPVTLGRIANLEASANAANRDFMAAAPAARSTVQAGTNAAVGSDRWADAQVALANLQSIRSRAMIALADLDRMYVDTATQGESLARIGAAHQSVSAIVAQQDAQITALKRNLR